MTATVINTLEDAYPNCRVTFILPAGAYAVDGGRVEATITSDDGNYTVLTARVDVPAEGTVTVMAREKE